MATGAHVAKKSGGKARRVILVLLPLAVLAAALICASLLFVLSGGRLISRGETLVDLNGAGVRSTRALLGLKAPEEIDLRGNSISPRDYEALAEAFPDCQILWDVPLGGEGESFDCLCEKVSVTFFSPEKAELYACLPGLREADLRSAELSPEDYELLRSTIPHCRILWSVPIAGAYWDSSLESLSLGDIGAEDLKNFAYFENLQLLELSGSSHELYMELEKMLPDCRVLRSVSLGDAPVDSKADTLDLEGSPVSAEELMEKLRWLPEARRVRLTPGAFSTEELALLREKYPEIVFESDVSIGGESFSCEERAVALGKNAGVQEIIEALPGFIGLEELDLRECGFGVQELLEIAEACPETFIRAEVELYGKSFVTDAGEIDLSGIKIEDSSLIESALPLFPNLEKVIMSDCGISNEDMDALNRRHEDVLFVWTVHFSVYSVRTDASAFCASNVPGYVAPRLGDAELAPIKYLTELEALDLGHMGYSDLSFLENMPKLRYLILVEANYRDISPIASLSQLYYLELFNNTIEDISPLLECKNLRHLNIGYTRGYDTSPLQEMDWLERLWYPGNQLSGDETESIVSALPHTESYFVKWDGDGSTGGGWREHESYFEMRDLFDMHYMPGGTGVPGN